MSWVIGYSVSIGELLDGIWGNPLPTCWKLGSNPLWASKGLTGDILSETKDTSRQYDTYLECSKTKIVN